MEIFAIIKHFMLDVNQFIKFAAIVQACKNFEPEHKLIFKMIGAIYELWPDKPGITFDEIRVYFQSKYASHKNQQHVLDIIKSALATDIGPEITVQLLEKMVEKDTGTRLAALVAPLLANQTSGIMHKIMQEAEDYFDTVDSIGKDDALQPCDVDWAEALNEVTRDSGIKWPINVLNNTIGGVKPSLGLIFARPNVGKTSLAVNCCAYFAVQFIKLGLNGLYLGNEENIMNVRNRYAMSLLGCTEEWAKQHTSSFTNLITQKGGNNFVFHGGVRSTRDVETLVKRYKPVVTILDQLPKFKVPGKLPDKDTERLRSLYEWFRESSQTLSTCFIGLCQADFKGANKPWITTDNINASKTDVPGELDWAIGVGAVDDVGKEMLRFVNVCKNKGPMDRDTVHFDRAICRYTD